MEPIRKCPKCGGPTRYYHDKGVSRVVCKGTCPDWTVIKEYDNSVANKKLQRVRYAHR